MRRNDDGWHHLGTDQAAPGTLYTFVLPDGVNVPDPASRFQLAQAVREGRRAEFAKFPQFTDLQEREKIPDPQNPATFASAKLDWTALGRVPHRDWHAWYQRVIQARRSRIVPRLATLSAHGGQFTRLAHSAVCVSWSVGAAEELNLIANLSEDVVGGPYVLPSAMEIVWLEGRELTTSECPAWTVCWSIRNKGSCERG
jgi:maltooligosyltrehalose trehalohydrolase